MSWLLLRRMTIFGAPVALGTLAAIHPMAPADNVATWNTIHTLQIPLAAGLGLALVFLLRGIRSTAARASRLAIIPWVAFFAAFDGVAGLATGSLAEYAHSHPHAAETVSGATSALQASVVVGVFLPLTATLMAMIVFGAAALALARNGAPVYAVAAIAIGGVVWTFVHPIIGAPAMALFLVGAAVVHLGRVGEPAPVARAAAAAR